ncbi:hypothetical protein S245_043987, partial [Arachis hypogaea]
CSKIEIVQVKLKMSKMKTIHSFFKRKERIYDEQNSASDSLSNVQNIIEQPVTQLVEQDIQPPASKITRTEIDQ